MSDVNVRGTQRVGAENGTKRAHLEAEWQRMVRWTFGAARVASASWRRQNARKSGRKRKSRRNIPTSRTKSPTSQPPPIVSGRKNMRSNSTIFRYLLDVVSDRETPWLRFSFSPLYSFLFVWRFRLLAGRGHSETCNSTTRRLNDPEPAYF